MADSLLRNIVAWARWQVPHEIVKEEKKAGEQGETKQPEGANVDLINEVWTRLLEGRAKWIGPKEYCEWRYFNVLNLQTAFSASAF